MLLSVEQRNIHYGIDTITKENVGNPMFNDFRGGCFIGCIDIS